MNLLYLPAGKMNLLFSLKNSELDILMKKRGCHPYDWSASLRMENIAAQARNPPRQPVSFLFYQGSKASKHQKIHQHRGTHL